MPDKIKNNMMKYLLSFVLCLLILPASLFSQVRVINATRTQASIRLDSTRETQWIISPDIRPDVYNAEIPRGGRKKVMFVTDIDSVSFEVEQGKYYDFIVLLNNKDSAYTRIRGTAEPAFFSPSYIAKNNHRTVVEIPEVYELSNILIALTTVGLEDKVLVYQQGNYYDEVMTWFGPYKNEKAVMCYDSILKEAKKNYIALKTDAYAFGFKKGRIVNNGIYDRIRGKNGENVLQSLLPEIERFAVKSKFRDFYKRHHRFYQQQISYYEDSINTSAMQRWLDKNFPSISYNCFKVILSPLVFGWQSSEKFQSNGFKEAQAHVNFPYFKSEALTNAANLLWQGRSVFTEFNHAYINPEALKYTGTSDFKVAFSDLKQWNTPGSSAESGYNTAASCFNEYMNWGLASLFYIDNASVDDQAVLFQNLDALMVKRGFYRFHEFNQQLITLYRQAKGKTVADLYPAIIEWFRLQVESAAKK